MIILKYLQEMYLPGTISKNALAQPLSDTHYNDLMGFFIDIFRTKSLSRCRQDHCRHSLKKSLGAIDLVLLGIGCIIGTGIFVLTGVAAALYAGPGIIVSFIITGIACMLTGPVYAEMASMLPLSGSTYAYPYAALAEIVNIGTLFAFVISSAGAIALRYRMPDAHRSFRRPVLYIMAPLAIVLCVVLMLNLPLRTWIVFLAWSTAGIIVYILYGCRHSLLHREKLSRDFVAIQIAFPR